MLGKKRAAGLFTAAGIIATIVLGQAISAHGGVFNQVQLTHDVIADYLPQTDGSRVVWQGRGGAGGTREIYLYNGSTITTVTANGYEDLDAQVSGNNIIWTGKSGPAGTGEIYFYNGSTITTLTANGFEDYFPVINGNRAAWGGQQEVYYFNGSAVTTVTTGGFGSSAPRISGNNIVWAGKNGLGGPWEIFRYNGSATTTLTATGGNYDPQINGNNIVWRAKSGPGGTSEIYFDNGSTIAAITANGFDDLAPQISGNKLAWEGWDGPGATAEIYFYDGSTTTKVTNNGYDDLSPQISGNNVVWEGHSGPGNTGEIFLYNGGSVIQLTNNAYNDLFPQISGNKIVWQGFDGTSDEIFSADIDDIGPSGAVSINGGSSATKSTVITLNLLASDTGGSGLTGMSFRDDSGAWSAWEPYTLAKVRILPSGNGAKKVWVKFRDGAANESMPIAATIVLDTKNPTTSLKTPRRLSSTAKAIKIKVKWAATDASPSSGVASYDVQYRLGRGQWKNWKTGTSKKSAYFKGRTGKTYWFRARSRDAAGNEGAWSKNKRTLLILISAA